MSPISKQYWRSLEDLTRAPEFEEMVAREFPGEHWETLPPATRRQFLKVMGASLALAGLTSCRWPEQEIVPFAYRPDGRTPGVPQQFATAIELAGSAVGLLVTSFDGRPIKVEGNPNHPGSLGGASALDQASVLGLYDPDRSRNPIQREGSQEFTRSWDEVQKFLAGHFTPETQGDGASIAVLAEASSSPILKAWRRRLLERYPRASWYEYEAVSFDGERAGLAQVYGRPLRAMPRLDRAEVFACFDADPLLSHPAAVRLAHDFAAARRPDVDRMIRLWAVEPSYSSTGAMADHRLAVPGSAVGRVLLAVARALAGHGVSVPGVTTDSGAGLSDDEAAFATALARDLATHRRRALVMAGPSQPEAVHALAHAVNAALGSVGEALELMEDPEPERRSHVEAIAELAGRMRSGEVRTLVLVGGNPAYDAPADLGFAELLEQVPTTVHLGLYRDETGARASWHIPRAHVLESWGDARFWDGTVAVVQPLIEPLYGGRTPAELVAMMLGQMPVKGYDLVRAEQQAAASGPFDAWWRKVLHAGVVDGSAWAAVTPAPDAGRAARAAAELAAVGQGDDSGLELDLMPDRKLWDGRFANNAWLQELPDALTKVAWDNALLVAPATADQLGVRTNDLVAVTTSVGELELPVYVLPGQAVGAVSVALGYGRRAAGKVGDDVGIDAFPVRTTAAPWHLAGVGVRATGGSHTLATTQDHHIIDSIGFAARQKRVGELVREADVAEYRADPEVFHEMAEVPPLKQLWQAFEYEGDQWGMSVDLNACVGCNACVVACQAENNVPVVGREQVIRQREMHWLRLDRYFTGPTERPRVAFQPLACVHCENAPCESVCPVGATQHTHDGLNAMVYNRCIGTRYCSNNCPYKVRRFNFFNYHRHLTQVEKMQYNPNVTVRSRGVMEKCTYCVQRIESARIAARRDNRPIREGEVVPACAQTCPAKAIVFGNLNDSSSAISAERGSDRAYAILAEVNTRARTHYLGRLRNPAEGVADGAAAGHGKEPVSA